MDKKSTVYVRTSTREFTFNTTLEILREYFPTSKWKEKIISQPFSRKTQTHLFGDTSKKPGEQDVIFIAK